MLKKPLVLVTVKKLFTSGPEKDLTYLKDGRKPMPILPKTKNQLGLCSYRCMNAKIDQMKLFVVFYLKQKTAQHLPEIKTANGNSPEIKVKKYVPAPKNVNVKLT